MNTIPHPEALQKVEQRVGAAKSHGHSASLINRSAVREFLLWYARENRSHKFTRVSKDTLDNINSQVRALLVGHVSRFPSKGETL
jgi:hypothetical protein